MSIYLKLLHILTTFWFVSGLIGRTLTIWKASKTADIRMVKLLIELAGYFEGWMVRPGSLAVLGLGLVTAWLQHWPLLNVPVGFHAYWLWFSLALYLSLIPVIVLIFVPCGKRFEAALDAALKRGAVTADLQAAFYNRAVKIAHIYELVITVLITLLMVLKPF